MRSIKRAALKGKIVLVRVDFNVPLREGRVADASRIDAALPTIRFLLKRARKVVLISHLGRPKGKPDKKLRMDPVAKVLRKKLKTKVRKIDDCINVEDQINSAKEQVVLLENVRFHAQEKKNSSSFARKLAAPADVFVNDAFGACHREHASVVAITKYLPSYAGLLVIKEVSALKKLDNPKRPFIAILGGAKIKDKIGLVKSLLRNVDTVLVGGAMMFAFYDALNIETGRSKTESIPRLKGLLTSKQIILPVDVVCDNKRAYDWRSIPKSRKGLDIGPETQKIYAEVIRNAKTIFWNGPMGFVEQKPFDRGTRVVAKAIANAHAYSLVGGGDTIASLPKSLEFSQVSTGGGASLEFLEKGTLPGLKPLKF